MFDLITLVKLNKKKAEEHKMKPIDPSRDLPGAVVDRPARIIELENRVGKLEYELKELRSQVHKYLLRGQDE